MIEINLLPGAGKKPRSRGVGLDMAALATNVAARIRDPYLICAVAAVCLATAAVGGMHWGQLAQSAALDERLQKAEQDSIRFATVIREKHKAEAQRDSVAKQLGLIRSIDSKRFVWPHIMDEVSRALPPYTWLTSLAQTNSVAAAAPAATPEKHPAGASADSADSTASQQGVRFRVVGNTVDIQALTRFMKLLEASPFVENVQLVKSALIIVDGKEVTEFQLDAAYQSPDSSVIRTVPISLAVR